MGDISTHREDAERILSLGGAEIYREASETSGTWEFVIPAIDNSNGGGGIGGGRYVFLPLLEHSFTVHYNQTHYVSISGGISSP